MQLILSPFVFIIGYMIFGFETAIVMAISYLIGLIIGMLTIK